MAGAMGENAPQRFEVPLVGQFGQREVNYKPTFRELRPKGQWKE
jgi:hypothetical protein